MKQRSGDGVPAAAPLEPGVMARLGEATCTPASHAAALRAYDSIEIDGVRLETRLEVWP